ncbi:unnamed protein product [Brassica oleracea]
MNYEHICILYRRISHPTFIFRNLLHNILYICMCSYSRAWLPVCHKYIPISLRNLWLVAYRVVKHDQSFSWCISSILSL